MSRLNTPFALTAIALVLGASLASAEDKASLAPLAAEGMVEIDDEGITVTARGWFFVRAVAMSFDRYLRGDQARERFSRIF